ncbi:fimbria/pilus outer membrane usher protein [Morganella psychrotolerans]|uniref:fimbria/pilus outer membrane usher protein n=1 Tax=Morganella psychrotolerans TaxID=368603 RepID=UPI0009EDA439|nr:fimbria/pilus outer membrane usher protein [Morganella psychrotolerans]
MIMSSARTFLYSSIMTVILLDINTAKADDYFDPAFVTDPSGKVLDVDLSPFEKSSFIPGIYRVDIYVNDQYANTQEILFYSDKNQGQLQPCLSDTLLAEYGVKPEYYALLEKSGECVSFKDISGVKAEFRGGQNRLNLSIPQIAFDQRILEAKQELLWNDGIPAIFTDYNLSGIHQNDTRNHDISDSLYLGLRSGINIGAWRYRNYSTWSRDTNGDQSWENQLNYLERPLRSIKSNILIGDNFSDSNVFDNVSFRGIKLWSDDQMRPAYANVYAPAISGVATIDSTIDVYQNGYVIYRTNIPAGPYELTDVVPLNSGSNLSVVQRGVDGSERRFIVPFSSLDFLQRKGGFNYSITAGQYRMNNRDSDNTGNKTKFVQSDAFYGLTDNTTLFGGFQAASRYQAYDLGIGMNIPVIGAVATDIMFTRADPDNFDSMNGRAFRFRYSKSLTDTGTNISFASYRYMSGDYITMTDMFDNYTGRADTSAYLMRKGQMDITVSQDLPEFWGMINASVSHQTYNTYYSNRERNVESYNVGYSNALDSFTYTLNYSYYKNTINNRNYNNNFFEKERENDHVISLSINIPLSGRFKDNWISYGASYNKDNDFDNYVGVGGLALENNNLSWSVQQGYGNHDRGNYGSVYGRYRSRYGDANAGYSYKNDNRRLSYGLNGSLMMSQYGATLSRPLGDTNGLIYAPGAEGVRIINSAEARTDNSGLAVVPNLIPYRNNLIRLDPLSMPDNAEIDTTLKEVYPTRGALVLINYDTYLGNKILVTLRDRNGEIIPFGAYTESDDKTERFYVSNYGRLYLTGVGDTNNIHVIWGDDNQYQCNFSYTTEGKRRVNGLYIFDENCL